MKVSHAAVRSALAEHGPMTTTDIAGLIAGSRQADVASILNRMRRAKVKLVYIARWTYGDGLTQRVYPRAVYALGNRYCAKRPKPKTSTDRSRDSARRRSEARHLALSLPNSVFAYAQQQAMTPQASKD